METVRGYLGEPVAEVLATNHYAMDLTKNLDHTPIIFPKNTESGEQYQFLYGKPGAEIELPTAKLIWFTQYAGTVTQITVSGSAAKQTLEEVFQSFHAIRKQFLQAKWQETTPMMPLDELKEHMLTGSGNTGDIGAGTFRLGNAEAVLTLSSPGTVMTSKLDGQKAFVAQVWFHDETLENSESAKAYAARSKVNGSPDKDLPLSYWVK